MLLIEKIKTTFIILVFQIPTFLLTKVIRKENLSARKYTFFCEFSFSDLSFFCKLFVFFFSIIPTIFSKSRSEQLWKQNAISLKMQNPVNFLYRVPILDLDLQPQHSCCCHSIAAAHVCSPQKLTAPEFQYKFSVCYSTTILRS